MYIVFFYFRHSVRFNLEFLSMDLSDNNESTLLISVHGNPPTPPDKRKPYHKKLAIRLILASILFERIAFYSIASQFDFTLRSDPKFKWNSSHSSTATYIFSGQ